MLRYTSKGGSFFPPPADAQLKREAAIMKGLEIWKGFYSSLRPGPGRIFLNIDIVSQAMIKDGNLVDLIADYTRTMQRGRMGPAADVTKLSGRMLTDLSR